MRQDRASGGGCTSDMSDPRSRITLPSFTHTHTHTHKDPSASATEHQTIPINQPPSLPPPLLAQKNKTKPKTCLTALGIKLHLPYIIPPQIEHPCPTAFFIPQPCPLYPKLPIPRASNHASLDPNLSINQSINQSVFFNPSPLFRS